jgi:hypothetical protein
MTALTVRTVTVTAAAINRTAVAASDTITGDQIGPNGVIYDVNNAGGSTDNITVSDPGATPAGNPASGAATSYSVAAGAQRQLLITKANVNPATGVATITHSFTTSVTAEAYKHA